MQKYPLVLFIIVFLVANLFIPVNSASAEDKFLVCPSEVGEVRLDWRPEHSGLVVVRQDGIRQAVCTYVVSYDSFDNPELFVSFLVQWCEELPCDNLRVPSGHWSNEVWSREKWAFVAEEIKWPTVPKIADAAEEFQDLKIYLLAQAEEWAISRSVNCDNYCETTTAVNADHAIGEGDYPDCKCKCEKGWTMRYEGCISCEDVCQEKGSQYVYDPDQSSMDTCACKEADESPTDKEEEPPTMQQPYYPPENKLTHHTQNYKSIEYVFRRAQWFKVEVVVQDFSDSSHTIRWLVDGIPLTAFADGDKWGIQENPARKMTSGSGLKQFQVFIPVNASIGLHTLQAGLYEKDSGNLIESTNAPPFYVIFNPWPDDGDGFVDDEVYNPAFTTEELEYYAKGDSGALEEMTVSIGYNYESMGFILRLLQETTQWLNRWPWDTESKKLQEDLEAFELNPDHPPKDVNTPDGPMTLAPKSSWWLDPGHTIVFTHAMGIVGNMDDTTSPYVVADKLTNNRIIHGCWEYDTSKPRYCGDRGYGYDGKIFRRGPRGTMAGWYDLPRMLYWYVESKGKNRPLGQCLDFAGLSAGFARAVGIPARQVTCTLQNHPSFIYHAWTEIWFNNEWHVADEAERVGVATRYNEITQKQNIIYASHVYAYDPRIGKWSEILGEYR